MAEGSEFDEETTTAGLRAELFVRDVPRSAAFYREVLGFDVLRQAPSGYMSLSRDGAILGLNDLGSVPEAHPVRPRAGDRLGLGVELVVVVDDVTAAHDVAVASGNSNVSALVRQPWGLTDFRVQDPDGYYIRVTGKSGAV